MKKSALRSVVKIVLERYSGDNDVVYCLEEIAEMDARITSLEKQLDEAQQVAQRLLECAVARTVPQHAELPSWLDDPRVMEEPS